MEPGFINRVIKLDRPRPIYYAGEVLSGTINFVLHEPLSYSSIKIEYHGEAIVSWIEEETVEYNGIRRLKKISYDGNQIYFKLVQILSGGGATMTELLPGRHQIPFKYLIPHGAPSSFKGERGEVSYYISTYMEFQGQRLQQKVDVNFQLIAPRDFNVGNIERLRSPIEMEIEEYHTFCFSTQPVIIKVFVPLSGYCPGQTIPITVKVDNRTAYEIKKMVFQLTQKERYQSQRPPSEYVSAEKVLATVKRGPMLTHTDDELALSLVVPDFIAVNLENCGIIDLGYFLKMTIKFSGCADDITDEAELCLGQVPLRDTAPLYAHPCQHDLPPAAVPDPLHHHYLPPIVLYTGVGIASAPSLEDIDSNPKTVPIGFNIE